MPNTSLSYDDLAIFLAVAREGSFIAAAKALRVPGSTVSRRVAELEQRLGTQLVIRSTRRLALSEAGHAMVRVAAPHYADIDTALRSTPASADQPLAGRLHVTFPRLAGAETVGPWIVEFAAEHPELQLEMSVTNDFLGLIEHGIDLAFRLGPIPETREIARRLWGVSYAVCAAPACVARYAQLQHPRDLAQRPVIITPPIDSWSFEDAEGTPFVLRLDANQSRCTVTDLPLGATAARQGLGFAYLPVDLVRDSLSSGELVVADIPAWRLPEREMYAVYPAGRQVSNKVRRVIDHVIASRRRADAHPEAREQIASTKAALSTNLKS